jgi:hypothetical protein
LCERKEFAKAPVEKNVMGGKDALYFWDVVELDVVISRGFFRCL